MTTKKVKPRTRQDVVEKMKESGYVGLRPGECYLVSGDNGVGLPTLTITFACIEDRKGFRKWWTAACREASTPHPAPAGTVIAP